MSILHDLGIHGWDKIESQIIASIMLGEPFALISEPGTGKTFLGKIIGEALELNFGYYDVSKGEFQDVIGFPSLEAMKAGKIEPIPTKLTIQDKQVIVVDELSRINRSMSNAWLEILGSRMLMGEPLPLRVIMGAMNPISHQGTKPLDEAFADRFIAFIPTPIMKDMPKQTRKDIIASETGLDAPSARWWAEGKNEDHRATYVLNNDTFQEAAKNLQSVIQNSAQLYLNFEDKHPVLNKRIIDYLDLFSTALSNECETKLEGRRLKMMKRFIEATIVTRVYLDNKELETLTEEEIINIVGSCIPMTMPQQVTGQGDLTAHIIKTAHEHAASALKGDKSDYVLYNASSLAEKFALLLENKYDDAVISKIVNELDMREDLEADILCMILASLMQQEHFVKFIPADNLQVLLTRIGKINFSDNINFSYDANSDFIATKEDQDELISLINDISGDDVHQLILNIIFARHDTNPNNYNSKEKNKSTISDIINDYYSAKEYLETIRDLFVPIRKKLSK